MEKENGNNYSGFEAGCRVWALGVLGQRIRELKMIREVAETTLAMRAIW